jgi:hypothetical protein
MIAVVAQTICCESDMKLLAEREGSMGWYHCDGRDVVTRINPILGCARCLMGSQTSLALRGAALFARYTSAELASGWRRTETRILMRGTTGRVPGSGIAWAHAAKGSADAVNDAFTARPQAISMQPALHTS